MADETLKQAFLAFCREVESNGVIAELQRDLFHCLNLFMNNSSAILPAFAAMMYKDGSDAAIGALRVFRDEYPVLRDLYINTFESAHKALLYVLVPVNIVQRQRHDDFGGKCDSIPKFNKLTSHGKRRLIDQIDGWPDSWDQLFDRELRNSIGHHSARHELSTGMIIIDKGDSIPYLKFLIKIVRQLHGILIIANVLKMTSIFGSK